MDVGPRLAVDVSTRSATVGHLTAVDRRVWRVAVVTGLLDPDNPAMLRHLPGVRRVLVVASAALPGRLGTYFDAQCRQGPLDGYRVVVAEEFAGPPFVAVGGFAEAAAAAGLGRRDAFVVCGHGPGVEEALVAAALFRRHTAALRLVVDPPSLAAVALGSGRTTLPAGIAVRHRHMTVLVDKDTVHAPEASVLDQLQGDVGTADTDSSAAVGEDAPPHRVLLRSAAVAALARDVRTPVPVERVPRRTAPQKPVPRRTAPQEPAARPPVEQPAPLEWIVQRTLTYHVEAVRAVFDPGVDRSGHRRQRQATGGLAAWLPQESRVLAVVDAFSADVVGAVRRYLRWQRACRRLAGFRVLEVAGPRSAKTLSGVERLISAAGELRLGRDDRVLAIGGGTVLDLTGAAALMYEGATPYVRIPTTMVGMIDAGVGLKVGVDVNARKNLLGGYHPPLVCLCDADFLATLPAAEIRCGLAEAIKIAMVADGELFEVIERHWPDVFERRHGATVRWILERSTRAMLAQLAANPFENDLRRLPDFGHEYGHLLESASGYRLRHGEAVSVGMVIAGELGVMTGRLSRTDHARMTRLLRRIGLPTSDPLCEPQRLWRWLRTDICAHKGGAPHLVVPTGIGTGGFIDSIDEIGPDLLRHVCTSLSGSAW